MFVDTIVNGVPNGEVAGALVRCRFDPGYLRPYLDSKGRPSVSVLDGFSDGKPKYRQLLVNQALEQGIPILVNNATTLRKDEWALLDTAVVTAARARLRAWQDLETLVPAFSGFDGMSRTVLEYEAMSDPGEAVVDMDALSEGRDVPPLFELRGLPLPIIHTDFRISARKLAISRNTGTPLDTTLAEAAGRRVAETVEKMTIGIFGAFKYGSSTPYGGTLPAIYGYTNFARAITVTGITVPTGSNGEDVLTDWLNMRDRLYQANFYGPFMVYTSTGWDKYLDNLFSTTEPSAGTLRERLKKIDGIIDIKRLDYLTTDYMVIWVQMTADVARAVVGLPPTVVRWEATGGLEIRFKVMAIMVPQLRYDFNGNCGILYGTS